MAVQCKDPEFQEILRSIRAKKLLGFTQDQQGIWRYKDRVCVPASGDLRNKILEEAHKVELTIHPGGSKMYADLNKMFWWSGMKRDKKDLYGLQ